MNTATVSCFLPRRPRGMHPSAADHTYDMIRYKSLTCRTKPKTGKPHPAGNHCGMRGTCTENLHLSSSGNAVNRKNTKTVEKHGQLSKNHFTSVLVKDWFMSPHGITVPPRINVHEIRGISFDWPAPITLQFLSRCDKKWATKSVRDIHCGKNVAPGKAGQSFTLGYQICHESIGRTRVSIQTRCSNFGFILLRFRDIVGATFAHLPLLFPTKFGDVPLERSMSSVLQWVRSLS